MELRETAMRTASMGRRLKEAREYRGLSQQELADKSGLTASYISKIENDKQRPENRTLKALADELLVDLLWLEKGTESPQVREALKAEVLTKDEYQVIKTYRSIKDENARILVLQMLQGASQLKG